MQISKSKADSDFSLLTAVMYHLRSISHCMLKKQHLTVKSYGITQNSSRLPKSSEEFCSH